MFGSLFSFPSHRERWLSPQRRLLEKYLTKIQGFYIAQTYGLIGLKLMSLALGGLIVWGILQAKDEGTTAFVLALLLLAPFILPFAWIGLFTYSGLVLERLNPRSRFRRVRRAAHLPQSALVPVAEVGDRTEEPDGPEQKHPGRRLAAVLLLILSIPALIVLAEFVASEVFNGDIGGIAGIPFDLIDDFAETSRSTALTLLAISLVSLIVLLGMLVLPPMLSIVRRRLTDRRRRTAERRARSEGSARSPLPDLPAGALRSSPRGQLGVHLRAGLFLLLGVPVVLMLGYCLVAYLHGLWTWLVHFPSGSFVSWEEPAYFSELGAWFFDGTLPALKTIAMTVSLVMLCAGVALARLSLPLLTRHGAEAIDLALTPSGVIVRGGLEIGWDEIAEVLVVRDLRIGAAVTRSAGTAFGDPGLALHPTYTSSHSRTRIALELHDLGAVADRACGVEPPRHRSLRADRTGAYGYALCDLWSHSHRDVADALEQLSAGAAEHGVLVTDLERVVRWDHLDAGPEWLGVMLTWS